MSEANTPEEYDEVHRLLARLQSDYPSLTLDELHEIFDETYDRCIAEYDTPVAAPPERPE